MTLMRQPRTPEILPKAMALAMEWGDKIPTGILYERGNRPLSPEDQGPWRSDLDFPIAFDAKKVARAIA